MTLGSACAPSRDDAAGEEDLGVADPAAVGPAAGDDDPALRRSCPCPAAPRRRRRSAADRRTARRGSTRAGRQRAGCEVSAIATHQPGRRVAARDLLGAAQRQARVELEPARPPRGRRPASGPSRGAGSTSSSGKAPLALGLRRQLARQGRDLARRGLDLRRDRVIGCPFSPAPVRLLRDHSPKEERNEVPAADPPRRNPDAARPGGLGDAVGGRAERRLRRLQGDQRDPRRHPRRPDGGPESRDHGPGGERRDADHRWPVRRRQGGARRLPVLRGRRPRRRDRARRADSGRPPGRGDRGPARSPSGRRPSTRRFATSGVASSPP